MSPIGTNVPTRASLGRKRRTMVSNEGFREQARNWVEFQNQIKGIKSRHCTTWVDTNGVPDQGASDGGC